MHILNYYIPFFFKTTLRKEIYIYLFITVIGGRVPGIKKKNLHILKIQNRNDNKLFKYKRKSKLIT